MRQVSCRLTESDQWVAPQPASRPAAGQSVGLVTPLSEPRFDHLLLANRNSFQPVLGKTISSPDLPQKEKKETGEVEEGELKGLQVVDFEVRLSAVVEAVVFGICY